MKKILSIILTIALIITMLPLGSVKVKAASGTWDIGVTAGTVSATLTSDGTLTVSGTGVIKKYASASVTPWYSVASSITSVVVEEGITEIGDYTFASLAYLTSVSLPNSLIKIGYSSFSGAKVLTKFTIPENVTTLDNYALAGCILLEELYSYSANVTLASMSLNNTPALLLIHGYSGSTFETYATTKNLLFENLSTPNAALKTWDISKSADGTIIASLYKDGRLVISGTGETKDLTYSFSAPWNTWIKFIKKGIIEEGITGAGNYALAGASNMTELSLPSTLTKIGLGSFMDNTSIKSIVIPDAVTTVAKSAFSNCASVETIQFSKNMTTIPDSCFFTNKALKVLTIPDNIEIIDKNAFVGFSELTSINFGKGVTSIGTTAFLSALSLKELRLPANIKTIAADAFNNCTGVLNVYIDGVGNDYNYDSKFLSGNAFTVYHGSRDSYAKTFTDANNKLFAPTEATDGELKVWDASQNKDGSVTAKLYDNGTLNITGTGIIYGCAPTTSTQPWAGYVSLIKNLYIENGITGIGDASFKGITQITNVEVPGTVTTIGAGAFQNCTNLLNIYIYNKDAVINKTYSSATYLPFPTTTIIHGLNSSTAKSYANSNGNVFELIEDSAPSGTMQTVSFNKTNPTDIQYTFSYGFGSLKATGIQQINIAGKPISPSDYTVVGNTVTIKSSVFMDLPTSTNYFVNTVFNDFYDTQLNHVKVRVDGDVVVSKSPTVIGNLLVYTKWLPKDMKFTVDFGTSTLAATAVTDVVDNGVKIDPSYWSVSGTEVSIKKEYFDNKENGKSYIDVKFNDTAKTVVEGYIVVDITGEDMAPQVSAATLEFDVANPKDIVFYVYYGYGTKKATTVSHINIDGTDVNIWNVDSQDVTVDKSAFATYAVGSIHTITAQFNDTAHTTQTVINVKIVDSTPVEYEEAPYVSEQSKTFNKLYPTNITYDINTGEGSLAATGVRQVWVSGVYVDDWNWSQTPTSVTINSDIFKDMVTGTDHIITTEFNDVAKTTVNGVTVKIAGEVEEDLTPYVRQSAEKYEIGSFEPVRFSAYLGSGTPKAGSILSVKLDNFIVPNDSWTYSYQSLYISAYYLNTLTPGNTYTLNVTFDNATKTVDSNSTIQIMDDTVIIPDIAPTLQTGIIAFDRSQKDNMTFSVDFGSGVSGATRVNQVYLNGKPVGDTDLALVGNTVTLFKEAFNSYKNAEQVNISVLVNDSKNSVLSGLTVLVLGDSPIQLPDLTRQTLKYVGQDLVYDTFYTQYYTEITGVKVNGQRIPVEMWKDTGTSLIIYKDYLDLLGNGLYSIGVVYGGDATVEGKLYFTVPKDTSSVTPQNSLLNFLYVIGSESDITIPLSGNPTSIDGIYFNSEMVDSSLWYFNSSKKTLTLTKELFKTMTAGTSSMIVTISYEATVVQQALLVGRSMTAGVLGASTGDVGIIISAITNGTTGLTYHQDSNGNTIIDGYTGTDTTVTIPSDVNGSPVTGIDSLGDSNNVDSVTIPGSVTAIQTGAISNGTTIVGDSGSIAEQYATNNGNTFTNTGNTVNVNIPGQTITYNQTTGTITPITNVNVSNGLTIDSIKVGNYTVVSGGAISLVSGSAIGNVSNPFVLDTTEGTIQINPEIFTTIGYNGNSSIQIIFSDGTVINGVTVTTTTTPVVPTTPTTPTYPTNPDTSGGSTGVAVNTPSKITPVENAESVSIPVDTDKVKEVYVNGNKLPENSYTLENGKLIIKSNALLSGSNNISITLSDGTSVQTTVEYSRVISSNKTVVMCVGSKIKIRPVGYSTAKKYATSNSKIATISKDGIVTAKKSGTVTIYVRSKNGDLLKVKITVKANPLEKHSVYNKKSVVAGKTVTLSSQMDRYSYKSSNVKIASVTSKGVVKFKTSGKVKIYMAEKDNGLVFSHTVTYTVKKK